MNLHMPLFRRVFAGTVLGLFVSSSLSAQFYLSSIEYTVVATNSATVDTTENTGVAVKARFDFDHTLGFLRVTLTNLSGTAGYTAGTLMGFGFDGPAGLNYIGGSFITESVSAGEPGGVDYSIGTGYNFSGLAANGSFDFGASTTGADGNGGGSPSDGIAGGHSAVFRFQFNGDLSLFSEAGFFANNGADADIGFRFQEVGNTNGSSVVGGRSEKLVYFASNTPLPTPEPSTYGLIGAGLLVGAMGLKNWRARRASAAN